MKTNYFKMLLVILIGALPFLSLNAQCSGDLLLPPNDYYPPEQTIRVHFHFPQVNGGGNFRAGDDGLGNTNFTGYDFAQQFTDFVNANILGTNVAANIYGGSQAPPVKPKRYKISLQGVSFWSDATYKYYYQVHANSAATTYLNNTYGVNVNNTVNVYFFSEDPNNPSCCGYGPGTTVFLANAWNSYQAGGGYIQYQLFGHELGHNLTLSHTIGTDPGSYDGCDDTPNSTAAINAGFISPFSDNNLMAYQLGKALTPCQLKRIYKRLMNSMKNFTLNTGCEYTNIDLEVTGNETWANKTRTYGNIVIKEDAHLTVQCSLIMSPGAYIKVEAGGQLTVDGALITNSCGSMWNGIRIEGVSTQSQYLVYGDLKQGKVTLKNNAVLENALVGIESSSGGIISATATSFVNNEVDVQFWPYTNIFPPNAGSIAGQPTNNLSSFYNCTFSTNQTLNNASGYPDSHVKLWYVDGINFRRSVFENTRPYINSNIMNRGYGIWAEGSSFSATGICANILQYGNPCQNYYETEFKGLAYGIYASTASPNHKADIRNCIFTDNWRGVYLNGLDNSIIQQSDFHINDPLGWDYPHHPYEYNYGVYIRSANGYSIEENNFDSESEGVYGIFLSKTNQGLESTEKIYRNTFNGLVSPSVANHRNDGLLIKCNSYYNTLQSNIAVEHSNGKIANPQGTCTTASSPAGNYFDNPNCGQGVYDLYNTPSTSITYNHHTSPAAYDPDCQWHFYVNDCGLAFNPNSSCPSNLGYAFAQELVDKIHVKNIKQGLAFDEFRIKSEFIDGGNTQGLIDEVNLQADPNVLINALNTASPYLSDAVMLEMLEGNNVLSEEQMLDVLVVNSSLSQDVLNAVYSASPPWKQANLNLLASKQNGHSARSDLETELLTLNREAEMLTDEIITDYIKLGEMTDSIQQDSIIALLERIRQLPTPGIHYDVSIKLASAYMRKGDFGRADLILSNYENSINANHQAGIMKMEIALMQNGLTMADASPSDQAILAAMAADQSKHGWDLAQSILSSLNGVRHVETFDPINGAHPRLKSLPMEEDSEVLKSALEVYPNPTNGSITFSFDGEIDPRFLIQIFSSTGQKVHEERLTQAQQILDLSGLKEGLYLISYKNELKKLIISQK